MVAIDEGVPSCQDLRGSDDINIVIRRSEDNGRSWSEIEMEKGETKILGRK